MRAIRCLVMLVLAGLAANASASPAIYLGPEASDIERGAATDLQRLLYAATGSLYPIEAAETAPAGAQGIALGTPQSLPKTPTAWPLVSRNRGGRLHPLFQKTPPTRW